MRDLGLGSGMTPSERKRAQKKIALMASTFDVRKEPPYEIEFRGLRRMKELGFVKDDAHDFDDVLRAFMVRPMPNDAQLESLVTRLFERIASRTRSEMRADTISGGADTRSDACSEVTGLTAIEQQAKKLPIAVRLFQAQSLEDVVLT